VKRQRTMNFLLSDAAPYVAAFTLMLVPYLLFTSSPLFPLELVFGPWTHLGICSLLITYLGFCAWLGNGVGKRHLRTPAGVEVTLKHEIILWCVLATAMAAHVVLLATSGLAFLHGGFTGARGAFLFQGLGVIMRLYMPVVPLLACVTVARKGSWTWLWVLAFLVLLRAVVVSERLALIEFILTLWVAAKVLKINIRLRHALMASGLIVLLFTAILTLRVIQSRDSNVRGGGVGFTATNTIAYYTDTQNKFYLYSKNGYKLPYKSFLDPINAFVINKAEAYRERQNYLNRMGQTSRSILAMLTNPGGLTLMVSDFGVPFGLMLSGLGFAFSGYILARIQAFGLSLMIAPLMVVQIADFPRENYIALPFGTYVALFAVLLYYLYPLPASHAGTNGRPEFAA